MSIPDETTVEPLVVDDVTLVEGTVFGACEPEECVEEAGEEDEGGGCELEAVQWYSHRTVEFARAQNLKRSCMK